MPEVSPEARELTAHLERLQGRLSQTPLSFLELLPVFVWAAAPTGESVFFGKASLDFWGKPLEDVLGFGWAETVHPADVETSVSDYRAAVASRSKFITVNVADKRRYSAEAEWRAGAAL